jgi:hypothetical protein
LIISLLRRHCYFIAFRYYSDAFLTLIFFAITPAVFAASFRHYFRFQLFAVAATLLTPHIWLFHAILPPFRYAY